MSDPGDVQEVDAVSDLSSIIENLYHLHFVTWIVNQFQSIQYALVVVLEKEILTMLSIYNDKTQEGKGGNYWLRKKHFFPFMLQQNISSFMLLYALCCILKMVAKNFHLLGRGKQFPLLGCSKIFHPFDCRKMLHLINGCKNISSSRSRKIVFSSRLRLHFCGSAHSWTWPHPNW